MRWVNAIREQVRQLDAQLPLGRALTLTEMVASQIVQPRFTMALFAFFGALGLALTAAGIYSVLSYQVSSRTQEIGVRMALGARRVDVLLLMLGAGCRLVAVGLVLGIAASLLVGRLLQSQLFAMCAHRSGGFCRRLASCSRSLPSPPATFQPAAPGGWTRWWRSGGIDARASLSLNAARGPDIIGPDP